MAVYFTKRTITQASRAIPIAIEIQKATVFLFGYSLKMCCGITRCAFIQLFKTKLVQPDTKIKLYSVILANTPS
ncbi:MAG TPA: hypothetical protein DCY25_10860 [Bacteroidales bacterium]|nr:hypothetical protein [Bacteroidales bacterium]